MRDAGGVETPASKESVVEVMEEASAPQPPDNAAWTSAKIDRAFESVRQELIADGASPSTVFLGL